MLLCTAVHAQALPDSVRVRFTFDPLSLYKPSGGFGLGGGMEVTNLLRMGSTLKVDAYVAEHRGAYGVAFAPRDLLREGFTSAITAYYETQGRLAYHGIGPATRDNVRVFVDADAFEGGVYGGYRRGALGGLATVRFRTGQISSFKDDTDDAFDRLDERSAFRLEEAIGKRVEGVTTGAALYLDTRDSPYRPFAGVMADAGVEVFTGSPASTVQPRASLSVYAPVGTAGVAARAMAVVTRPFDADDPVPLVLLPRLDNSLVPGFHSGRFAARDLVVLDVRMQHPIQLWLDERITGRIATDAFVVLAAFNAYDDLFTDVRWAPTWKERFEPEAPYPLRASVGVGLHAYDPETKKPLYTVVAGLSAEGISLSTLTFTLDPRKLRPLWRW